MNNKVISVLLIFFVILGLLFFISTNGDKTLSDGSKKTNDGEKVVIHKSPTCGCCGAYASYMKSLGYEVEVNETDNLDLIKTKLGVPMDLESCHTTEIAGYVVEGHIPNEVIVELLALRPDIKGIGMAGMPSGSPGMGGKKTGDFMIYEIREGFQKGDLFMSI